MFSVVRKRIAQNIIKQFIYKSHKVSYSNICCLRQFPTLRVLPVSSHLQQIRTKSKKKSKNQPSQAAASESESEVESTIEDDVADKHSKLMSINVNSPRVDVILKSSLGIARNKIETYFYESKIRVNGQKIMKKSELANEGDEIDVIKGPVLNNPNLLTVARVEVLKVTPKSETIAIKVRRNKNLMIDKYEDFDK